MSNKLYKLYIFDVDGTLLDTSEGITNSIKYTIEQMGYREPSQDILNSFIGPRIQDSFQKVYGLQGEELNKATTIFRNQYKKGDVLLAKPYDGVYMVLKYLRECGVHIAVATNKRQDFVDELLEKYDFMSYIEEVYGTDFSGKLSKTDLIRKCMCRFSDCHTEDAVMIGDSSYDAVAAQEVGVDFIGVTYGFDFKEKRDVDKWNNVGCVNCIKDLLRLC